MGDGDGHGGDSGIGPDRPRFHNYVIGAAVAALIINQGPAVAAWLIKNLSPSYPTHTYQPAQRETTQRAMVKVDNVPLRWCPNIDCTSVTTAKKDDVFDVIQVDGANDWLKLRVHEKDKIGYYAEKRFLKPVPPQ